MEFNILTIFPKMFDSYFNDSIIGKAIANEKIKISIINIRNFADNKHKKIDDEPYGGGPGMLMMIEPIVKAIKAIANPGKIILLSPQGKTLTSKGAKTLASNQTITLICGRYEGIDHRIYDYIHEEWSIGDYVLTGGELGAMVLVDTITRFIPGIIKHGSALNDSFENDMLDYPQYTRPPEFDSKKVPAVLMGGDHKKIRKWREKKAKELTRSKRPDLMQKREK